MVDINKKLREAWDGSVTFPIVISRSQIPVLTHVLVDGVEQSIGEVYDFRAHTGLKELIPNEGRTSLAWVRLGSGDVHKPHFHPVASMVVICEGEGELTGDLTMKINAGDIVMIPAQALHGFIGEGANGFWAVSIQFDGNGLYEAPDDPRMSLKQSNDFTRLKGSQVELEQEFANNNLVRLVQSPVIQRDAKLRDSLLDVLHVWSNHFQDLIRIRAAAAKGENFKTIAVQHMQEELGHNNALAEMRNHRTLDIWDPVIESVSSWFSEKMAKSSDIEATILMHLVIEEAGNIFHGEGAKAFPGSEHFEQHGIHDDDHAEMGWKVLGSQHNAQEDMQSILLNGWKMMNLLCNRMAEVACEKAGCSINSTIEQRMQPSICPTGGVAIAPKP